MAEAELSIILRLKDEATKQLNSVFKTVQDNSKQFKIAGAAVTGFGIALGGALLACAKAAGEQEVEIVRLSAALRNVGEDYNNVKYNLESVISATQKKTAVSDSDQRASLTQLINITGNYNKALELLPLTLDLARGASIDFSTAAMLIGKVAQGNTTLLSRYGIIIREGADATEALAEMQKRFGGQAEAYGNTTAGAIDKMKNAFDDLKESLGEYLLPEIQKLAEAITDLIDKFNALPAPMKEFIVKGTGLIAILALIIGPILLLIGYLPQIVAGFKMIAGLFGIVGGAGGALGPIFAAIGTALTGPIGLIILALILLIAQIIGAIQVWKNWEKIPEWLKPIITILLGMPGLFVVIVRGLQNLIANWDKIADFFKNLWANIVDGVKTVAKAIGDWAASLLKSAVDWGKNIVIGLWEGIKSAAAWLWDKLVGFAKSIFDAIKQGLGALWPFSPSELGIKVGEGLILGMAKGITNTLGVLQGATGGINSLSIGNMGHGIASKNIGGTISYTINIITSALMGNESEAREFARKIIDFVREDNRIRAYGRLA